MSHPGLHHTWNHWPIGLIGIIGFGLIALSASAVSLAHRLVGLVGIIDLLTHRPFLDSLATALITAKTKISCQLKQAAAHGVSLPNSRGHLPRSDTPLLRFLLIINPCLQYIHLMKCLTSQETVDAKQAFEHFAEQHGLRILHYHCNNG